jgi:hypothetical protein
MNVKKILLLIWILSTLIGCVKDQLYVGSNSINHNSINHRRNTNNNPSINNINDTSINNINGSWVVMSYKNLENNSIIEKSDVESRHSYWHGMDVALKFMDSTICGFNTTNDVFGHYILRDSTIKFDVYGDTRVGQPQWGNMFSDIVYSIESFKCNETQLIFFYNNYKNSVTLYRLRQEIKCDFTW